MGDVFERIKETAAEVLDRTIEVLARPAAKPIWSQMKQNAQASIEAGRGCTQLADALVALKAKLPQVEIHLIGHSAGSILLGYLLDLLPARALSVASCHLYAPACTVRFALDHYAPAITNKTLDRKRLHIHLLSDRTKSAIRLDPTVNPFCILSAGRSKAVTRCRFLASSTCSTPVTIPGGMTANSTT